MIEYTERIYYLGIPWLTREVIAFAILISIALFAIVVLFNWRNIVYSRFANLILGLLVLWYVHWLDYNFGLHLGKIIQQ